MGDLVEFPRKLEWQAVESWMGVVPNTELTAKVERARGNSVYTWFAWNGAMVVAAGTAQDLEAGKEAVRIAFEKSLLVVRVRP